MVEVADTAPLRAHVRLLGDTLGGLWSLSDSTRHSSGEWSSS